MLRFTTAAAFAMMVSASPLYAQDTLFTVTTPSANVHAGPSTGSPIVATTQRGAHFEVTREVGSWVQVAGPALKGGSGYLHATWGKVSHGAVATPTSPASADAVLPNAAPASPQAVPAQESTARPASTSLALRNSSAPPSSVQTSPAAPRTQLTGPSTVAIPSHVVGIGGRLASAAAGFAASGRVWAADMFGIQFELGRSTMGAATFGGTVRTTTMGSSAIYSTPNLVASSVLVRPFVGGGASFHRSTLSFAPGVAGATDKGLGGQLFGGAEFTWASLPHLALGAEVRQEWSPIQFPGFETGGLGVGLSAHWYVK